MRGRDSSGNLPRRRRVIALVMRKPGPLLLLSFLSALGGLAPVTQAHAAGTPPLLRDTDGVLRRPLATDGDKAVVLVFISDDCPISNGYAPEINRLCAAYGPKKIGFRLVSVDTGTAVAAIKRHARQYGYRCPDLLDPGHALVGAVGATVTPEVAVYGPNGRRLYQGRIDDKYADFGKVRFDATTHDLQAALDAILAGRSVPHARTKAVGCPI